MPERIAPSCGCLTDGKVVRGMCSKHYFQYLHSTSKENRTPPPRFSRDFSDFVDQTHRNGCWLWLGPTDRKGYGRWSSAKHGERGLAHRISLARVSEPEDPSLFACHHCDNPPCVNPAHLYWGTVQDNTRDMVTRKGVHNKGVHLTHCNRGHELRGTNLRIVGKSETRKCRTCDNHGSREYAARARQGTRLVDRQAEFVDSIGTPVVAVLDAPAAVGVSLSTVRRAIERGDLTVHALGPKYRWLEVAQLERVFGT
ncbi:hypothetical protein ATK86_5328 [Nocardia fluminea]|uniref:HNH endonuclease n=1 Tax=Nocardia fluminea TaxID=134984 RepID=A0A2N3VH00_9NOCA|nr:hypothetical protein ATK86_5328 [Nocardia fluminea]